MLIEGLAKLNDEKANAMSLDWAARWTRSNFIGYQDSRVMYEKVSKRTIQNVSVKDEIVPFLMHFRRKK